MPRAALRDGNRVWVMTDDKTLDIRDVTIAWQSRQDVYTSEGLAEGEMLITSDLAAPVPGMALRTPSVYAQQPKAEDVPQGGPETREPDHAE